jgi:predicted DNA-binding transcriptional regulator AlpA
MRVKNYSDNVYSQTTNKYNGLLNMNNYQPFLNLNDSCDLLNVDKSTFRQWRALNSDFPPAYQPRGSRSVRYDAAELIAWMKSHPIGQQVRH